MAALKVELQVDPVCTISGFLTHRENERVRKNAPCKHTRMLCAIGTVEGDPPALREGELQVRLRNPSLQVDGHPILMVTLPANNTRVNHLRT